LPKTELEKNKMGALSIKLFSKKYLPLDSNNSDHQQDRELKFFLKCRSW